MHIARLGAFGNGKNTVNTNMASATQNNASMRPGFIGRPRKDRIDFSGQGKLMQMLESIAQQKEVLIEQKSQLINRVISNGGKIEDIQEPLDFMNEKLAFLDEQAANLIESHNQMQIAELTKKQEEKNKIGPEKERTQEEVDSERLNIITEVSASLKQNQATASGVKQQSKGAARTLSGEAKIDTTRADMRLFNAKVEAAVKGVSVPATLRASIARSKKSAAVKATKAKQMLHNANKLDILIGKQANEALNKISDSQKLSATKESEEDAL